MEQVIFAAKLMRCSNCFIRTRNRDIVKVKTGNMIRYLVLLVCIFCCYQSGAQEGDSKINVDKLRFGAFIAPNIAWMHPTASKTDDGSFAVESDGNRIGYVWGLMMDYFFTENYGL